VDVMLNFVTDSYSDSNKTLLNNKQIAFKYITSYFLVDLLSFLPQLISLETFKGTHPIYMLKLLRYFRIKRSFR